MRRLPNSVKYFERGCSEDLQYHASTWFVLKRKFVLDDVINTERKQKISIAIQVSTQIMSRYAREYSVKCAVLLLENFVTYKAYIITFEWHINVTGVKHQWRVYLLQSSCLLMRRIDPSTNMHDFWIEGITCMGKSSHRSKPRWAAARLSIKHWLAPN